MMIAIMSNNHNAKMKNNPRTNTIAQIQKTTWQDVPESGLRYHYHTDIPDNNKKAIFAFSMLKSTPPLKRYTETGAGGAD